MVFQIYGRRSGNQEQEYGKRAVEAWDQAWDILHQTEGWHAETEDSGKHKGCVYSRKFNKLGKVYKLEAFIDATIDEVYEVLVTGVVDWPKWNPTILECKHVETINENTDIAYSVGAPQLGGLVSSRDFVNLRHWKSKDGILMASACSVVHPDMPAVKQHIRAENNPASYVFKQIPGEPNKCHFVCILSTDLKGWLPQFLIDQAMSGILIQYLGHLKEYLIEQRTKAQQKEPATQSQDVNVNSS